MTKEVTNGGDNGKEPFIPYGSYYLLFIIISVLSLVYIKKKQISL